VSALISTVTFCNVVRPATTMSDGYGLAGPLSGMVMVVGLLKWVRWQLADAVAVGVGLGVPPPPVVPRSR
jgi:hypothetical protein